MASKITPLDALNRDLKEIAAELTDEQVVMVQKQLTFSLLSGFIMRTPVDEGNARGGWMVGINLPPSPNALGVSDTGEIGDPNGPTLSAGLSALSSLGPYQVVYITNNVPYILVLDQGEFDPPDPSEDEESRRRRASSRSDARRAEAKSRYGHEGATFVERGFSKQAPAGIVDATIASVRGGLS